MTTNNKQKIDKMEKINELSGKNVADKQITRKEAIKKAGYITLSTATMMLLLNSQSSAHGSPAPPPPVQRGNDPQGTGIWKKK